MKINKHFLEGSKIKYEDTPNHGGPFKDGDLDTIVLHYTGSPNVESAVRTLKNPKAAASAHLIIGRDGEIVQMAPFNIVTWHAGKSEYKNRVGFNQYSIGIEIVNAGPLTKSGNVYRAWFGTTYPPEEVIEATHKNQTKPAFWHTYTDKQIEVVTDICELLASTYDIKFILGHDEIAPKRKMDPGPAFPIDKIRDNILNSRRDQNEPELLPEVGRVMVDKLNIRSAPNENGSPIAQPLKKGAIVKLLEEQNGWYKVTTEVEGWVFGKYIGNQ